MPTRRPAPSHPRSIPRGCAALQRGRCRRLRSATQGTDGRPGNAVVSGPVTSSWSGSGMGAEYVRSSRTGSQGAPEAGPRACAARDSNPEPSGQERVRGHPTQTTFVQEADSDQGKRPCPLRGTGGCGWTSCGARSRQVSTRSIAAKAWKVMRPSTRSSAMTPARVERRVVRPVSTARIRAAWDPRLHRHRRSSGDPHVLDDLRDAMQRLAGLRGLGRARRSGRRDPAGVDGALVPDDLPAGDPAAADRSCAQRLPRHRNALRVADRSDGSVADRPCVPVHARGRRPGLASGASMASYRRSSSASRSSVIGSVS